MENPTMPYNHYRSTACQHKLHDKCRLVCKYCDKPCTCYCHAVEELKEKKNG